MWLMLNREAEGESGRQTRWETWLFTLALHFGSLLLGRWHSMLETRSAGCGCIPAAPQLAPDMGRVWLGALPGERLVSRSLCGCCMVG